MDVHKISSANQLHANNNPGHWSSLSHASHNKEMKCLHTLNPTREGKQLVKWLEHNYDDVTSFEEIQIPLLFLNVGMSCLCIIILSSFILFSKIHLLISKIGCKRANLIFKHESIPKEGWIGY